MFLVIYNNLFLVNECLDKVVINIGKIVKCNYVIIINNNFMFNLGCCVFFEGIVVFLFVYVLIFIIDNLFNENFCENNSVVEVFYLDENVILVNNIFI